MPASPLKKPSIFADPTKNHRTTLVNLLDTLNIQGPKPVALLGAILNAVEAETAPYGTDAIERVTLAAVEAVGSQGLTPTGLDPSALYQIAHRHITIALPELTAELMAKLRRFLVLFDSWRPDGSGRVDTAPRLEAADASITFSQQETHRLRHLLYVHLPAFTSCDAMLSARCELLNGRSARPSASMASPRVRPLAAAEGPPCAIITVGPVGSGKSWVLHDSDSPIDQLIRDSFGDLFPAPVSELMQQCMYQTPHAPKQTVPATSALTHLTLSTSTNNITRAVSPPMLTPTR